MAQVGISTQEHIRLLLSLGLEQWSKLPEVEATIAGWDLLDRLTFIETWPLEEMRLDRLEEYASSGAMSSEQLRQFAQLKRVASANLPIIRRLQQG